MSDNQISKVKRLKNKVIIFFDNHEKIEVSNEILTLFYIYEGKKISDEEIDKIILQDKVESLKSYAISIRKRSYISEWKLREKLYAKEANKKEVDAVIESLKYAGLINDEMMMGDIVEYLNSKNYGQNKIKDYLASKGVFEENIDKLSFDFDLELIKAKNNLNSLNKKYSKLNYEQRKSHIYNALLNRGFTSEVINNVINKIGDKDTTEELEILKKDYLKAKNRLKKKYNGKELNDKIISSLMMKGYKYNDIMKVSK